MAITHDSIFGMELGEVVLWLTIVTMTWTLLKKARAAERASAERAVSTESWRKQVDKSLAELAELKISMADMLHRIERLEDRYEVAERVVE